VKRSLTLAAYRLLRYTAEVFAYLHIVCYAIYSGLDWCALWITEETE